MLGGAVSYHTQHVGGNIAMQETGPENVGRSCQSMHGIQRASFCLTAVINKY